MKKKNLLLYLIVFLASTVFLLSSCSTNIENNNDSIENKQSRQSVLSNIVDNLILPSHDNLLEELNSLKSEIEIFNGEVNYLNLSSVRKGYRDSYNAWQYVELYNIGKSEEINYVLRSNTYPCNKTIINSNIELEINDLSADNFLSYASQGFPAIDYILYGLDQDTNKIIDEFLSSDGQKILDYLIILTDTLIENTQLVTQYWNNNRDLFINNNGNSATSSMSKLINDFIYYYEKGFRANKIGIPAGVYSNSTLPQNVEAKFASNLSKRLSLSSLSSIEKFFKGESFISSNINGESISSHLLYLDATNQVLIDEILIVIEKSRVSISNLDDDFAFQVINDNYKMLETFDVIQECVPLMKVDMMSALNISVDYVDADGD